MRCKNCNKKIKMTKLAHQWYHVKHVSVYCEEPKRAEPRAK